MRCSRCHGLMLNDHLLDMEGEFEEMWAQTWRCTNCGALHDAVIEQNRLAREANLSVPTSGQPHTQGDETYLGGEAFVRPAA
jgi:translation elongation factor EF-4